MFHEETKPFSENPESSSIALTRIQKLIGDRMLQSKLSKPCFYIEIKADVTELMGLRPKLRKTLGVKITTDAFYIRALALAAKRNPLVLGKIDGDNIKIPDSINVGFAVNAPQGLVVPVIKDADEKTLAEIAGLGQVLIDKARDNKLTLEEMEGETIALSNLGAYGIDSFLAIVPPPTSTVLAVGNVNREIVPIDGKPVERKIVSLSLAVDRRVTDEVYAAKFLNTIGEQLQNPQELV
ncbi:MAG: 2-oxo acid dehydrogenase subunit E2 [Phycisphaerae bacterium]|nr:2-oxo acid dehydrogenase subunit E2 [Phycisphaerae bacterium]MDD5380187.1 2-oxo acid dehydrogenase subunit E2 [Phycisphaerae bacterium]